MSLQGVKFNPFLEKEDLRRMSLSINELVKDANRAYLTITHRTITANASLDDTGGVILMDASTASITLTVPNTDTFNERIYWITRVDGSTETATVDGVIDGSTTTTLTQYESLTITKASTQWYII